MRKLASLLRFHCSATADATLNNRSTSAELIGRAKQNRAASDNRVTPGVTVDFLFFPPSVGNGELIDRPPPGISHGVSLSSLPPPGTRKKLINRLPRFPTVDQISALTHETPTASGSRLGSHRSQGTSRPTIIFTFAAVSFEGYKSYGSHLPKLTARK